MSGDPPKHIVLLLHGYGSNGADLISLAPHWQRALPNALFLAPNAPQRLAGMGSEYQWWPLQAFTPQALALGASSAAPAINAFIDRKLTQYSLGDADLAIVGFSQGTMMALHVGLRRRTPIAGILGYSGMLTGAAELHHEEITKPPVLLIHGSADPVVPVSALKTAENALRGVGVDVITHVSVGVGHSVDPTGLRMGGEFIGRVLGSTMERV
ncbi:MAG: alpha/beta fold hydrolase [Sphingomicrobium sp.]